MGKHSTIGMLSINVPQTNQWNDERTFGRMFPQLSPHHVERDAMID